MSKTKPYYVKENLFEYNGRTWEHLYDHPSGYTLRVFNEDMSDYDYKEIMSTHNKKNMSKTKPNIFKSRTKEWDANEWQGRSKRQVENNYKVNDYVIKAGLIAFLLWALTQIIL